MAALEKLRAYIEVCVLDREECLRLAALHRRLVVERKGLVEAEDVDRAWADALDLQLRIEDPEGRQAEARIMLRLDDPSGARWLHDDRLAERAGAWTLAVELVTFAQDDWEPWSRSFSKQSGFACVLGLELKAHALVIENGVRS